MPLDLIISRFVVDLSIDRRMLIDGNSECSDHRGGRISAAHDYRGDLHEQEKALDVLVHKARCHLVLEEGTEQ